MTLGTILAVIFSAWLCVSLITALLIAYPVRKGIEDQSFDCPPLPSGSIEDRAT